MFYQDKWLFGGMVFLWIVLLVGIMGCAEGDSLFTDAGNVHSGRYEQDLANRQAAVARERDRGTALSAEQQGMQSRAQLLDQEIARQKKTIKELDAKVARLDRQAQQMTTADAAAERKRSDLQSQISQLKREINSVQEKISADPSASELEALRRRQDELSHIYSDLLQIYKSM